MSEAVDELFLFGEEKMEKAVNQLKHEFGSIRSGRAKPMILDKVMLGSYGNFIDSGNYEQAMKISKMALMIIFSFCTVMTPRITYYFSNKSFIKIRQLMKISYSFNWMLSMPICFGLIGIANNNYKSFEVLFR